MAGCTAIGRPVDDRKRRCKPSRRGTLKYKRHESLCTYRRAAGGKTTHISMHLWVASGQQNGTNLYESVSGRPAGVRTTHTSTSTHVRAGGGRKMTYISMHLPTGGTPQRTYPDPPWTSLDLKFVFFYEARVFKIIFIKWNVCSEEIKNHIEFLLENENHVQFDN